MEVHEKIFCGLIEKGADIDATNALGETVLINVVFHLQKAL